jgi:hypothetical protein
MEMTIENINNWLDRREGIRIVGGQFEFGLAHFEDDMVDTAESKKPKARKVSGGFNDEWGGNDDGRGPNNAHLNRGFSGDEAFGTSAGSGFGVSTAASGFGSLGAARRSSVTTRKEKRIRCFLLNASKLLVRRFRKVELKWNRKLRLTHFWEGVA